MTPLFFVCYSDGVDEGFDDVIVSAHDANYNSSGSGSSYVSTGMLRRSREEEQITIDAPALDIA